MEEISVLAARTDETECIRSLHETLAARTDETERIRSLHDTLMVRTAQMEHIIDVEPSIQITMPSGVCDFKVALARLHADALEDHVGATTFGRRILQLLSQTTLST
jgi:hypothetical protein